MPTLPNDVLARIIGMLMDDAQAEWTVSKRYPPLCILSSSSGLYAEGMRALYSHPHLTEKSLQSFLGTVTRRPDLLGLIRSLTVRIHDTNLPMSSEKYDPKSASWRPSNLRRSLNQLTLLGRRMVEYRRLAEATARKPYPVLPPSTDNTLDVVTLAQDCSPGREGPRPLSLPMKVIHLEEFNFEGHYRRTAIYEYLCALSHFSPRKGKIQFRSDGPKSFREALSVIVTRWCKDGRLVALALCPARTKDFRSLVDSEMELLRDMPCRHIRVLLPEGADGLAMFGIPWTTHGWTPFTGVNSSTPVESKLHPQTQLFEVETLRSDYQDFDWLQYGGQLPGQVCRIQSGQSPWPLVSVSDLAFESGNDGWLEGNEEQARVEQSPYLPSECDWDFLVDDDSLVSV